MPSWRIEGGVGRGKSPAEYLGVVGAYSDSISPSNRVERLRGVAYIEPQMRIG
jgi:hypothetical protein